MPWVGLSHSHGEKELAMTLVAANKALEIYSKSLNNGVEKYLHSKVMKPVFRKYN